MKTFEEAYLESQKKIEEFKDFKGPIVTSRDTFRLPLISHPSEPIGLTERLIRVDEVNGCKPYKYCCCERCVYGSGEHTCATKLAPATSSADSTHNQATGAAKVEASEGFEPQS